MLGKEKRTLEVKREVERYLGKHHNYNNEIAKEYLLEIYKCLEQIEPIYYNFRYDDFEELAEISYERYLFYMSRAYMFLKAGVYWEVFDNICNLYIYFGCLSTDYGNLLFCKNIMYNIKHIILQIGEKEMIHDIAEELGFDEQKKIMKKWGLERFIRKLERGKGFNFERLEDGYKSDILERKNRQNYSNSIKSINKMLSHAGEVGCSKKDLIDYLIDLIGRDLKQDCLANIIYGRKSIDLLYWFPDKYYNKSGEVQEIEHVEDEELKVEVDFSKICTFSIPWNHCRVPRNLAYLKGKKFLYDKTNHYAIYYPEINICHVYNGRHSASIGISNNKGKIKAEQFNIKPLFGNVHTDGYRWYCSHSGFRLERIRDFRFGLLFELAKMKSKIA